MQRLFIIGLAFILCLGMALGSVLFLSLLPHLDIIGWCLLGLVATAIGCCTVLLIAWCTVSVQNLLSRRNHNRLMSRVIMFGDGGAAALDFAGNWQHLSAIHEHAKIPPPAPLQQIAAPKKVEGWSDKQTCIDLWVETGQSQQAIADQLNVPKSRVQKWLADYKKEQGID